MTIMPVYTRIVFDHSHGMEGGVCEASNSFSSSISTVRSIWQYSNCPKGALTRLNCGRGKSRRPFSRHLTLPLQASSFKLESFKLCLQVQVGGVNTGLSYNWKCFKEAFLRCFAVGYTLVVCDPNFVARHRQRVN